MNKQLTALDQGFKPSFLFITGMALLYAGTAWLGIYSTRELLQVATVWLPNALLLSFILRTKNSFFLPSLIFCFCTLVLLNYLGKTSALVSVFFAVSNIIEVIIPYYYIRKKYNGLFKVDSLKNFLVLISISLIGCICSALLVGTLFKLASLPNPIELAFNWGMSDCMSMLVALPFLMRISFSDFRMLGSKKKNIEFLFFFFMIFPVIYVCLKYIKFPLVTISVFFLICSIRLGFMVPAFLGLISMFFLTFLQFVHFSFFTATLSGIPINYINFFFALTFIPSLMVALLSEEKELSIHQLRESEQRFRDAIEFSSIGMALVSLDGHFLKINPAFADMTGYSAEELLNFTFQDITYKEDLEKDLLLAEQLTSGKIKSYSLEKRYIKKDGSLIWILLVGSAVLGRDGKPIYCIAQIENIDRRKKDEAALRALNSRLTLALESGKIGIWEWNFLDNTLSWDENMFSLYSVPKNIFSGVYEDWENRLHPEDRERAVRELSHCVANKKAFNSEFRIITPSGETKYIRAHSTLIVDEENKPKLLLGINFDISEEKKLEQKLKEQASHDLLTGLFNRRELVSQFNKLTVSARLVEEKRTHEKENCLCYVDLDYFKNVNDSAGHAAGDLLLVEVGQILRSSVRATDIVARMGGDEFVLLLSNCSLEEAKKINDNIIHRINDIAFQWENKLYRVGASIGITSFTSNNIPPIQELLSQADIACYSAKSKGRNRLEIFSSVDESIENVRSNIKIIYNIESALAENRIVFYAEKIISLTNSEKKPAMIEILSRLKTAEGELIYPKNFIPIAEQYSLITLFDKAVITQLFTHYSEKLRALGDTKISINLSAHSVVNTDFTDFLKEKFKETTLPKENLIFEITETAVINNFAQAASFVDFIKQNGASVALDDFGAGYAPFNYLKTCKLDYIKIDGAFIRDIDKNKANRMIVESIHQIAHAFHAKTIAEYTETQAIFDTLKSIGIDYVQGSAIQKPIPLDDYLK